MLRSLKWTQISFTLFPVNGIYINKNDINGNFSVATWPGSATAINRATVRPVEPEKIIGFYYPPAGDRP